MGTDHVAEEEEGVERPADYREARRVEALEAGLTEVDAMLFADGDVSLSTLRHCIAQGATPAEIARIVV